VCVQTCVRGQLTKSSHWRGPREVGLQAFYTAAFNASIGAWNTARVVDMSGVCAVLAGGALRGTDMRLVGVRYGAAVCAVIPSMCAPVRVHVRICIFAYIVRVCIFAYMCMCPYVYIWCSYQRDVRARVCVRVLSGAHTRKSVSAVLTYKIFTLAWTAWGLAGISLCGGVQREHWRLEHRIRHDVVQCMPAARYAALICAWSVFDTARPCA
jgi:hypothetical protein